MRGWECQAGLPAPGPFWEELAPRGPQPPGLVDVISKRLLKLGRRGWTGLSESLEESDSWPS